ncbi:hypothetical protein MEPL4_4c00230 [Melissococcus plutonius]|uniref:hypothetical protein n=1 Tax=Melissococcus plutonius TaxID=33970 RepID=UPI00065E9AAB|nr:hypothetical protein [Melissococcus plutonius]AIM25750.1 hypothetical protein MEPL_c010030 [Melissococcus plutonius S1]KMT23434.1 hypothetical protein MEPL2_43p00160 [Melissococcus plutonius]KMT25192.1 hypothetical protein MEPL2_2c07500 [Melissococcus plutonius]KMT26098.1 hypothetical protein MEPL3_3c00230 [Melissococcus plutonius]KMT26828.1 hypothetical protein MEPL1_4c00230 [Melissococcus plutonius]
MKKLNEDLPTSPRELRSVLKNNFHLLNTILDFEDRETLETLVKQYADERINEYNKKIQEQIQHIVVPPTNHINTKEVKKYGL